MSSALFQRLRRPTSARGNPKSHYTPDLLVQAPAQKDVPNE